VKKKRRIVYMGTPEYAEKILERLIKETSCEIVAVFTQPDRPVGRKKILTSPPVKRLATEHGIRVEQPENLRDEKVIFSISELNPDMIIVAAYGQMLPGGILHMAPCINLHASLLPRYRGASPVQQSLLEGDNVTGVTAMLMEEGLDSGPVLAYSYCPIPPEARLQEMMKILSDIAAELTVEVVARYEMLLPIPQVAALASYCKKISRNDGEVHMEDAVEIWRKFRAFEGWPGIFLPSGLKLLEIELKDEKSLHIPGEILGKWNGAVDVGCRRGILRVHTLQPPGKKPMDAMAYLAGRGLKIADSIL